jgi:hypothetical protein
MKARSWRHETPKAAGVKAQVENGPDEEKNAGHIGKMVSICGFSAFSGLMLLPLGDRFIDRAGQQVETY